MALSYLVMMIENDTTIYIEEREQNMITSHANKGVKEVIQLAQKAKARKESGLYIVEGAKMFLEAPEEAIEKIYVSEEPAGQLAAVCEEKIKKVCACRPVPCETVSNDVFRKMSDTKTPQGILSVLRQPHYNIEEMLVKENPLLLLLEDIQDPGNLGTMFRAGEGAGITGVIMSEGTVDIYNPKTIRSTMGSIYRVPFVYVKNLDEATAILREKEIMLYAACLEGAKHYDTCVYSKGAAFIIGNEANGLQEKTAKEADTSVIIPMLGKVESLNAAVAASVLLFEAARQRRVSK